MRKCALAVQDAPDVEKDEPLDSGRPLRFRNVPANPRFTDQVQHPAVSEVDEEKPGARIHFQIAESVEEQVPAEIRKAKLGSRKHLHEAGKSATMRDVDTLRRILLVELRRPGCNKERVRLGNKADFVVVQVGSRSGCGHGHGTELRPLITCLNVYRSVSK